MVCSESRIDMRSRTTRSMRSRPMRSWFWINSPTVFTRRLPRWSMSSSPSTPLLIWIMRRRTAARSSFVSVRWLSGTSKLEPAVELVAAHLAQVVAAGGKDQVLQETLGVVQRGRIARAQLLVELEQRAVDALGRIGQVGRAGRIAFESGSDIGMFGSLSTSEKSSRICSSAPKPMARSSTVTGSLRLRSTFTEMISRFDGFELEPGSPVRDELGSSKDDGPWPGLPPP